MPNKKEEKTNSREDILKEINKAYAVSVKVHTDGLGKDLYRWGIE